MSCLVKHHKKFHSKNKIKPNLKKQNALPDLNYCEYYLI